MPVAPHYSTHPEATKSSNTHTTLPNSKYERSCRALRTSSNSKTQELQDTIPHPSPKPAHRIDRTPARILKCYGANFRLVWNAILGTMIGRAPAQPCAHPKMLWCKFLVNLELVFAERDRNWRSHHSYRTLSKILWCAFLAVLNCPARPHLVIIRQRSMPPPEKYYGDEKNRGGDKERG